MRFSVIIPLYNKAPYVKKAIESVLAQTWRDFELVVVDDGSSDDSYAIAESVLMECTIPYQLIHQENAGVSTARNNGVALSKGQYICFLDADDWWANSFLERMDLFIHSFPDAGLYGTNYYYIKNKQPKVGVTALKTGYINYYRSYAENLQMPIWTGASCLPREVFDEMGGFRSHLKLGEDFDLWVRITMKYKVAFLNEPLSNYYQDSNPQWRGVGHLVDPKSHILWNLDYMSIEEKSNPEYKLLIDALRVYSLFPYYLSNQFHFEAKNELAKVDWNKQPRKMTNRYHCPLFILRLRQIVLKTGVFIKQEFVKR